MTGLIILLPLAITLWIIASIVDWLTDPFVGIAKAILSAIGLTGTPILFMSAESVLLHVSQVLVLVFLFFFIILIGAIGRHFFFRYFIRFSDTLLRKIPIISSIYKTSQELIQTVFTSDNRAFKQVVRVPFPNNESWSIGLVTREGPAASTLIPVFVPTTPNPTSGYLIMYDRSKVIPLDMSVEEAFRYIISCGVLVGSSSVPPSIVVEKKFHNE